MSTATIKKSPPAIKKSHSVIKKPKRSLTLTLVTGLMVIYTLLPLVWLFLSSTKSQEDLLDTFGLWFGGEFNLFENIADTFAYQDGIFLRWVFNTLFYVVVGAGGATILAALAGYGLAKFDFAGRKAVFAVVLGGIAVPPTALAVPVFLMFAKMGLTDTPWAVIIPSLLSPFGLYLMWTYSTEAVPTEILESARVDGAGEFRTFFKLALPLLAPGLVTVLLFNLVATWNNFFIPLIMLKDSELYPLTLGLYTWSRQANTVGGDVVFDLVLTGSLLTIIPLTVAFLFLQRYWQQGLAAGSVKQ